MNKDDKKEFDKLKEYRRIMVEELKIINRYPSYIPERKDLGIIKADEIESATWRLSEIAEASFIPRSYVAYYGISDEKYANESDGAHTNLVLALINEALDYYYGSDFGEPGSKWPRTIDGYTRREIVEAARLHDLPENIYGDIPDNGERDNVGKDREEADYFYKYTRSYAKYKTKFADNVMSLLLQMRNPHSPTGRLLYMADKTAALLITLQYDVNNVPPLMDIDNPKATCRDKTEMQLCDYKENNKCRASEMWAIDFFKMRDICNQDEFGFFTAILVMRTLEINGKWYSWREKDYEKDPS